MIGIIPSYLILTAVLSSSRLNIGNNNIALTGTLLLNSALDNHSPLDQYVLITSNMYRPSVGGIENSLYHLAHEYKILGYKVIIVTSDINDLGMTLPTYEVEEGVEIFRYRACTKRGVLGFAKHVRNALALYKELLTQYQPAVIICRYHFNLMLLKLAGCNESLYLVPSIVKNETKISMQQGLTGLEKLRSKLSFFFHQWLQDKALTQAKTLFVFSENMRKQVAEITPRKDVYLTKPGVSLTRFYPLSESEKSTARVELGLATKRKVFLCVGRLVKVKGFETAIRAIVDAKQKNIELWILGDGPLMTQFTELVSLLKCEEQVKFLGQKSSPEFYYRAADVFVMSSIHEALGQTILEAMACGLPIIAAPNSADVVTASNEIIDNDKNYFTKTHNAKAFAEIYDLTAQLSVNEYQCISDYNRQQAQDRFSWSALAKDLLKESFVSDKESEKQ